MQVRPHSPTWGIALAIAALVATSAGAATLSVDSSLDENASSPPNGTCTLREALHAANTNTALDGCAAGDPGLDTVLLPAGVHVLSLVGEASDAGDLDVLEDLLLRGAGPSETVIDASAVEDRVLEVHAGATVTLRDLELRGGAKQGAPGVPVVGGGISNDGTLTLERVVVRENELRAGPNFLLSGYSGDAQGGGVGNRGSLTLLDSAVVGNLAVGGDGDVYCLSLSCYVADGGQGQGGGLYSSGPLVVYNSSVQDNLAVGGHGQDGYSTAPGFGVGSSDGGDALGGGIHATGELDVVRSLVAGNTARGGAGGNGEAGYPTGILGSDGGDGAGGAVYALGDTTLKNATLHSNGTQPGAAGSNGGAAGAARAGAVQSAGPLEIVHITLTDSSGGVHLVADGESTIANSLIGGTCAGTDGASQGGNLESPGDSCAFDASGDAPLVSDLGLDALADNGGSTRTRALLEGSPALGSGLAALCTPNDQRGVPRLPGQPCDSGAYEEAEGPSCGGTDALGALAMLPPLAWLRGRRRRPASRATTS